MNRKKRNAVIIIVCFIALVIGIFIISYNYLVAKKNLAFETVDLQLNNNASPAEIINEQEVEIENDTVVADVKKNVAKEDYIGFLEIPKINLVKGFVSKDSKRNNVNFNLQIIKPSDYPDVDKGNFIIAAHSGNSQISYFKNLYKLEINDVINVYYKEKKYIYKVINIYTQPKTGEIAIYRDNRVTTITLVTCTKNDDTTQTIYIGELISKEENKEG